MSFKFHIIILLVLSFTRANAQVKANGWSGDVPPTIVVPPVELQTGGVELFEGLIPVNEVIEGSIHRGDRIFLNQKINLDLIGPGTNLIFVSDISGRFAGFAVSNGQFGSEETNGSVNERTYPLKVIKNGKYPWPMSLNADGELRYLPGNKLITSNGPHNSIQEAIVSFSEANPHISFEGPFIGGHIGRNLKGQLYVGYTSGSSNGPLFDNSLGAVELKEQDARALPPKYRRQFHKSLKAWFEGAGLSELLASAPTETKDINGQRALNHYPSFPHKDLVSSQLELLLKFKTSDKVEIYLKELNFNASLSLIKILHKERFPENRYMDVLKDRIYEFLSSPVHEMVDAHKLEGIEILKEKDVIKLIKDLSMDDLKSIPVESLVGKDKALVEPTKAYVERASQEMLKNMFFNNTIEYSNEQLYDIISKSNPQTVHEFRERLRLYFIFENEQSISRKLFNLINSKIRLSPFELGQLVNIPWLVEVYPEVILGQLNKLSIVEIELLDLKELGQNTDMKLVFDQMMSVHTDRILTKLTKYFFSRASKENNKTVGIEQLHQIIDRSSPELLEKLTQDLDFNFFKDKSTKKTLDLLLQKLPSRSWIDLELVRVQWYLQENPGHFPKLLAEASESRMENIIYKVSVANIQSAELKKLIKAAATLGHVKKIDKIIIEQMNKVPHEIRALFNEKAYSFGFDPMTKIVSSAPLCRGLVGK